MNSSAAAAVSRGHSTASSHSTDDRKGRTVKNKEELPAHSDRGDYSDRSRPIRRVLISQPWACLREEAQEPSLLRFAEPPSAAPLARWCGGRDGQPSRLPDLSGNSVSTGALPDFSVFT